MVSQLAERAQSVVRKTIQDFFSLSNTEKSTLLFCKSNRAKHTKRKRNNEIFLFPGKTMKYDCLSTETQVCKLSEHF